MLAAVDDLSRAADRIVHEAGVESARHILGELPGPIERLVLERYWWRLLLTAVIMVGMFGAGAVFGYWFALH